MLDRIAHWRWARSALTLGAILAAIALGSLILRPASIISEAAQPQTPQIDLLRSGQLLRAGSETFPDNAAQLLAWSKDRKLATGVSLTGGDYWLRADARASGASKHWVFDPNNTLIDRVEARFYAPDGSVQRLLTGYQAEQQYMLHYGRRVTLEPGGEYRVLIRFSSPYFASIPRFELQPEANYRYQVLIDNILIIAALGAVISLALFYLFMFSVAREKSHLYYALYLISFFVGWAFVFHIPAELFGWRDLRWHYVPFFLLSPLSALFCIDFLRLNEQFPRLAKLCYSVAALSLLLLPSSFLVLSHAHVLATLVISLWLPLALYCGILSWRSGFRPAGYFVLAFIALIIPGSLILPANLGLTPDFVENAEILTLLGGTTDALLLALALADKIRLLGQEKDNYLARLNRALELAHTDSLTGIGNRHAFDQALDNGFAFALAPEDARQQLLILMDLDGLKLINDQQGHTRGDALLRSVARGLGALRLNGVNCYRLGGDEFALLGLRAQESALRTALTALDDSLKQQGFIGAGISYGIAYAHESASAAELINKADARMYQHKSARRRQNSSSSGQVSSAA